MKNWIFALLLYLFLSLPGVAQQKPYSQQMAQTATNRWPDQGSLNGKSALLTGHDLLLKGMEAIWRLYGDTSYFNYIQRSMDPYVRKADSARDEKINVFNIGQVNYGTVLLFLYNYTWKPEYKKAAEEIRRQLRKQPAAAESTFSHRKIFHSQGWADNLYIGQPFYAEYAKHYHEDTTFDEIAREFINIDLNTRDARTGLFSGVPNDTRMQQWANKDTANSPRFQARALGRYGAALVDVLDHFPTSHPGRDSIIGILNRFVKAVTTVQDNASGLWYHIVDVPAQPGNYKEASASCLLVYTIAKAASNGYINARYMNNAKKGYAGILKEFIEVNSNGQTDLKGVVTLPVPGSKPAKESSFADFTGGKPNVNDPNAMAAFILCSVEMERAALPKPGKGKQVLLDAWFNNEWRKDLYGFNERRHYTWDDTEYGGISLLGDIWRAYGARLATLEKAPLPANLKGSAVYIIIDPDGTKENRSPNYVTDTDAANIADWVKAGGVLLLMGNDSANCDLEHFNKLANRFGINFSDRNINMVKGDEFETGAVINDKRNPVFRRTKKMFLKDISVLEVKPPAKSLVAKQGDIVFATAEYGRGTVFAVGDPWLYNEYTDGRKIPAEYQNFLAANELVQWLLEQAKL